MRFQDHVPTVALVEDDQAVQNSITSLLKSVGYCCEVYGSAEVFLDACSFQALDCVILDFGLPGVNGLDLQLHLKNAASAIPIIMISAYDDRVRTKAFELGAIAVLPKPFKGDALLGAIRAALDSRS